MTRPTFVVPFARTRDGVLVRPDEVTRGAYTCPQCNGTVDLHAGERKTKHFHHRASARCTPESVLHLTAKQLIVAAVQTWKAGGDGPCFQRTCASEACAESTHQYLPTKVVDAVEELRLGSGRVVDVCLLGLARLPVAAVEVLHTHEVDDAKERDLAIPWMEVDASQVCETAGFLLTPVRDRFFPWLCEEHTPSRRKRARELRADPRRKASVLRSLHFRMDAYPGFRVERLAVCPKGHDALVLAWDGDTPPWPRPPLVVARESERDARYGSDGRIRRLLPFKRSYTTICPTCGDAVE